MSLKTFLCLSVLTGAASAQPVSVGLKIGSPLTDSVYVSSFPTLAAVSAETHRYVVGPYVELRLPAKFSVEVDALYRSYQYQLAPGAAITSVGSWEFPVMAKYKLFSGPVKPYLAGGVVFDHLSPSTNVAELLRQSNYGITLGAGLEIHALVLRISPEIRYDGFVFRNINSPGDLIRSNRNQAMFLVGIGF